MVSWGTQTRKNSPKILGIINAKCPSKLEEEIHKGFLESGQANKPGETILSEGQTQFVPRTNWGRRAAEKIMLGPPKTYKLALLGDAREPDN